MSKLLTSRYEYVVINDAQGNLNPANNLPPTYPPVIDQYTTNSLVTAGSSYGMSNVGGESLQTFVTTPGATVTIAAPATNTTLVMVSSTATPLTLGGGAASPVFIVGPGQTVTFPGVLNPGTLTAVACGTNYAPGVDAFTLQALWSL